MSGPAKRFAGSAAASVAIVFAFSIPMLIGASAFATDLGILYLERRVLQKAADAAALAAAADLSKAQTAARRMLDANGAGEAAFTLGLGRYLPDATLDRDERFVPGGEGANAVAVEARLSVPLYFGRMFGKDAETVSVRSRAALMPEVSFSIGSRLASVDPALADAVLGKWIGGTLDLDVMDYRNLARPRVELGSLLRGLAVLGGLATDSRVRDVIERPVTLSALLGLAADDLERLGDLPGAAVSRKAGRARASLALRIVPADILRLGEELKDLSVDYPSRALAARLSMLGLLSASLVDRGIGNEASLSLGLPGLAAADMALLLGEEARTARTMAVGRAPVAADTAQARARLRLNTGVAVASLGAGIDLPFELVVAGGRAELLSAACPADPARREVRLMVTPGVLRLSIGTSPPPLDEMTLTDTVAPAAILATPLVRVEAKGTLVLRQTQPISLVFRGAEIGNGTVKTVRTHSISESLVASLLGETTLTPRAGPLGLGGIVSGPLRTALVALAGPIDTLLAASLGLAGIGVGEADVRVDDLVCSNVRLVG